MVGSDVVDGGAALFLLVPSEAEEVLLSVRGHLSWSPGHDELP